jgi:cyanophycin synthetase
VEKDGQIDLSKRKNTSRMVVTAALERGWQVTGFESDPAVFVLRIPGKSDPIKIYSASPPQTSYAAAKITDNKYIVNRLLKEQGLPVPEEIVLKYSEINSPETKKLVESFMGVHPNVVVKPLDSAHGRGITLNVDSSSWDAAAKKASDSSKDGYILVQEQIGGHDVRAVCIGYEYVDAITRVPASVIGDGIHDVGQLIRLANKSPERGENYMARLNVIPIQLAEDYLGKDGLARIPLPGEKVQVVGVSNTGMGGERKNIRDDIPDFLKEYAEKAAETLDLPVCGVDFLVAKEPTAASRIEELKPYIIEVNWCPGFVMYEDINDPGQKALINKYLDYLAR